jgi:hypothetical protein
MRLGSGHQCVWEHAWGSVNPKRAGKEDASLFSKEVAISVYVLIAVVKKRLAIKASLYTMLQALSLTPFEKMPIDKAFFDDKYSEQQPSKINQLNLFDE